MAEPDAIDKQILIREMYNMLPLTREELTTHGPAPRSKWLYHQPYDQEKRWTGEGQCYRCGATRLTDDRIVRCTIKGCRFFCCDTFCAELNGAKCDTTMFDCYHPFGAFVCSNHELRCEKCQCKFCARHVGEHLCNPDPTQPLDFNFHLRRCGEIDLSALRVTFRCTRIPWDVVISSIAPFLRYPPETMQCTDSRNYHWTNANQLFWRDSYFLPSGPYITMDLALDSFQFAIRTDPIHIRLDFHKKVISFFMIRKFTPMNNLLSGMKLTFEHYLEAINHLNYLFSHMGEDMRRPTRLTYVEERAIQFGEVEYKRYCEYLAQRLVSRQQVIHLPESHEKEVASLE